MYQYMQSLKNKAYRALRWSEQYTKTDMLYLAQGGFWLNIVTVSNFLSSFLLLYIFANYLDSTTYGTYRYFLSFYAILSVFTLGGFNTAVTRSVARGFEGDFYRAFRFQFISASCVSIITMGIALYYLVQGNTLLASGFLIMAFALPLMESLDLYQGFLNGKRLFKTLAVTNVVSNVVTATVLLIAVLLNGSVLTILAVYFASWIAIKIFFFVRIRKEIARDKTSPGFFKLGANFSLVNLASGIAAYIDRVLIFHFTGPHEVAVYSFAAAPAEQIKGVFKNLSSLILPKLSARREQEIMSGLSQKIFMMALVITPLIVLYILVIPTLFSWFFPQYLEAVGFSQIYVISLFGMLVIPINAAMSAIPKVKSLMLANTISPIISIPVTYILISAFGIWGAVWAKLATRMILLVLSVAALITGKRDPGVEEVTPSQ